MTRANFTAPARREFLNEVAYYNGKEQGLGARFTEAVEEAAIRAMAYPLSGSRASANTRRIFVKDFHLRSSTGTKTKESSSSLLHIIHAAPITGGLETKTANQLLEPTCETHAAQQ